MSGVDVDSTEESRRGSYARQYFITTKSRSGDPDWQRFGTLLAGPIRNIKVNNFLIKVKVPGIYFVRATINVRFNVAPHSGSIGIRHTGTVDPASIQTLTLPDHGPLACEKILTCALNDTIELVVKCDKAFQALSGSISAIRLH